MKITVEFNSIKELRDFCFESGYLVADDRIKKADATTKESSKVDDNASITIATKPPKKEEPKKEEPKEEPEEEELAVVDVRKLLSVANKKVGRNIANEWITAEGFKSLTEIKDQKILRKLFDKAKEVTNAE